MTISVLLVDDQPLLRQGFTMILNAADDLHVAGEAADGAQAIQLARSLQPDVVLMDVRMPEVDGITATQLITTEHASVKVLLLTTFDLDEYAFNGLRAGASGFLLKDTRPTDLLDAIRIVARGDAVISPSTTRRLLDSYAGTFVSSPRQIPAVADELAQLTGKEREVFAALVDGLTNREIADRFTVSETTVKTHVARILAKLNLRDRVQVVIYAYENGLTVPGGDAS